MLLDGVWYFQVNYIFIVVGYKKIDRGGYGKIDVFVFYYICQFMLGGNCILKVLRIGVLGSIGCLVGGKVYRWDVDVKICVGCN